VAASRGRGRFGHEPHVVGDRATPEVLLLRSEGRARAAETKAAKLEAELAAARDRLASLEAGLLAIRQAAGRRVAGRAPPESETKAAELEAELAELRARAGRAVQAEAELTRARERIFTLETELTTEEPAPPPPLASREELEPLQAEVVRLRKEATWASRLGAEVVRLRLQVSEARSDLAEAREQARRAGEDSRELGELRRRAADLEAEVASLRRRASDVGALGRERDRVVAERDRVVGERDRILEELAQARASREELRQRAATTVREDRLRSSQLKAELSDAHRAAADALYLE
jgi:chromosome segregation protein